jgi:hypothetical protein
MAYFYYIKAIIRLSNDIKVSGNEVKNLIRRKIVVSLVTLTIQLIIKCGFANCEH